MKFFSRFIISLAVIVCLIVFFSLILFGISSSGKFGVRSMEETSFQDVTYLSQYGTVIFGDVFFNCLVWGDGLMNLEVDLADIDVKVSVPAMDGSLRLQDVNALTVTPIWIDRIIGYKLVRSKEVIVWVKSEEDKLKWEAWLEKNHTAYLEREKKNYRHVVPK